MVTVCVVDDDSKARERLEQLLGAFFREKNQACQLHLYEDGLSFLEEDVPCDVAFLDVDLKSQPNGLETARKLRQKGKETLLVFVTNFAQYAVASYDVEAFDYIVKPVDEKAFCRKMERVLKKLTKDDGGQILIKCGRSKVPCLAKDIYYLEVFGHKVFYYTKEGKIESRDTLTELEERLSPYDIVRCASCYMVNLHHVVSIKTNSVVVEMGEKGTISLDLTRGWKKQFLDRMAGFMNR